MKYLIAIYYYKVLNDHVAERYSNYKKGTRKGTDEKPNGVQQIRIEPGAEDSLVRDQYDPLALPDDPVGTGSGVELLMLQRDTK